jgi:tetratricopeptide (TPR) repeat protein
MKKISLFLIFLMTVLTVLSYSQAELNSEDIAGFMESGIEAYREGKLEEALRSFSRIIESETAYAEANAARAHYNRGNVYYDQEQYSAAIEDFSRAIELEPDLSSAYFNRGNAYFIQEEYKNAFNDFDMALSIVQSADAQGSEGQTGSRQQRPAALKDALPSPTEILNNRAAANHQLGEEEAAEKDLRQAISIKPQSALLHFNLGTLLYDRDQYQEAVSAFSNAIEQDPSMIRAYFNRGNAHYKIANYQQAARDFQKVLELEKSRSEAQFNLELAQKQMESAQ